MDNDLMARRLRPPSQPNSSNGQQPTDQPGQQPSPWDVALTPDGQFAPPDPTYSTQEPSFAPPDPAARADVPWDRPAPEPWPPTDDSATDPDAPGMQETWFAQGSDPGAVPTRPDWPGRPDWPAADALGESAPPWDRPAANPANQWHDPDDALAPVVADVQTAAVEWASWNGNGYASTPEPMKVTAHGDRPAGEDEPHSTGSNPLPEWPAEDDLTVAPPSGRGPVMPEDSWPVTPPAEPPAPPTPSAWAESPAPAPEPQPLSQPEPQVPAPAPQPPTPAASTPPTAQIVAVTPTGTAQNMVLRIEVAIVDESHRANPADAAKRVGPDAGVRRPEYEPRNSGGRASMPEPEYDWGTPPDAQRQQPQRRPRQAQPAQPGPV